MTPQSGRAYVYGDDIDTDVLAPGHLMKLGPEALAQHCLEAIDPAFAGAVKPGDYLVAGRNFGLGSSREQAAVSLKLLGLRAVIAASFARIFYRNAINLGLPAIVLDATGAIASGDRLSRDLAGGRLVNETRGETHGFTPPPPDLLAIIEAGGLMAQLQRRFSSA